MIDIFYVYLLRMCVMVMATMITVVANVALALLAFILSAKWRRCIKSSLGIP